jgi:predicted methyltransferase
MSKFIATLIGLKLWLLLIAATLFVSNNPVESQTADPARSPQKISRATSEPYKGDLSIFEGAEREKKLQIDRVMDILMISEGKSVADIGAGSGWFTVRAAKRVGTSGKVYAVEINPESIDHINKRAVSEGFKNIQTILGQTDDPTLRPNSVDAVLILKTYHEFAEPVAMMKKIMPAMKKGGLVGIIDRAGDGDDHGLDEATVISEMKLAGFIVKEKYDFVKGDNMDYFLVFQVAEK